jgi:hypothetical protein
MAMNSIPWSLSGNMMSFFTIRAAVQAFYTYRVYAISRHWWLAVTLWMLEFLELCLVTGILTLMTTSGGSLVLKEHYNGLMYVAIFAATAVRHLA